MNTSTSHALGEQLRITLLALFGQAVARLPGTIIAIAVLVATNYLARFAGRSATAVGTRLFRSTSLRILLSKAASTGTWLVGVLVVCLLLFPGLRLGDIVATLGLGSVAIGFAFQDIFKNFLAGVLILVNEPFRIGDAVVIGSYEGVVEHISIRTTNVRTYLGERVLIPNSFVFTNSVQVRTAFAKRRTDFIVGVAYDSDLATATELARKTIAAVEGVLPDPPVVVDATDFGESTIDLTVRYWTDSEQQHTLRTRSRVVIAIKVAFDEAGIELPFPSRSLFFRGGEAPAP